MADMAQPKEQKKGCYAQFKAAVKALKNECTAIAYAIQDIRCPWYARIVPFLVLGYALSPLDLIPDFIPILGLVDDLILLPMLLWLALKAIPTEVLSEARAKAKAEPIHLARNWPCVIVIFMMWAALVLWAVYYLCDTYGGDPVQPWTIHITVVSGVVLTIAFIWWLISATNKEKRKRAKALATAAAQPQLQHEGDEGGAGLTEPLLVGADETEQFIDGAGV